MQLNRLLLPLLGLVVVALCQSSCIEASFPLRRLADTNINAPVLIKSAIGPNNRELLFVGQQTGEILMWDITDFNTSNPSNPIWMPFADLSSSVVELQDAENETRGLLGLAFHRNFDSNGLFYVFYSANSTNARALAKDPESCSARKNNGDLDCTNGEQEISHENRLEEWKWESSGSGGSESGNSTRVRTMLIINHPFLSNNGLDSLLFDNTVDSLYLATGDGGCFRDPFNNAQNPDSLLGKLLHINMTSKASCDKAVSTFSNLSSSCAEFADMVSAWAWGFRDPRGVSQQLDGSGNHLIIAENGEQYKEIDIFMANNTNFGWDTIDGVSCVDTSADLCGEKRETGLTVAPAAVLNETEINDQNNPGNETRIVGGFQFMGTDIACLDQAYLFGTNHQLWFILPANYQNSTLDSGRCSTSGFNFTFSGLPVDRVVLSLEGGGSAGPDEYSISENVYSLGTTTRNDMVFIGTATTLRGDGALWVVIPSNKAPSS